MVINVLVPIDDSEPSTDALEFALEQHPDATITALHVIDPQEFSTTAGIESRTSYDEVMEAHQNRAEDLLAEARETAESHGADIQTDYLLGKVPQTIVEYVEDYDMDQVVIGSHGRTGASRVLLGSVAETVTRRCPVPVTVVR